MDLMSVITAVTHPGVDPEVPDARDPETAAVFTELLAGLMAAPVVAATAAVAGAPVATDPASTGTTGGTPGVESAAAAATAGTIAPVPAQADSLALIEQVAAAPAEGDVTTSGPGLPLGSPATAPAEPSPATGAPSPAGPSAGIDVPGALQGIVAELAVADDATKVSTAAPATTGQTDAPADVAGDVAAEVPAPVRAASSSTPDLAVPDAASTTDTTVTSSPDATATTALTGAAAAADDAGSELADSSDAGVTVVDAAQRTESTTPTATVSAPAETAGARTLERALAMQVAHRVGTLSQRPDGEYDLTLQLEPAELGRIELRVRMEGGVVHVQLGAHAASTTDAIRAALPDLRDALADAGLNAGSLDVGTQANQSDTGGSRDRLDRDGNGSATDLHVAAGHARPVAAATLPTLTGAARGVDVLL